MHELEADKGDTPQYFESHKQPMFVEVLGDAFEATHVEQIFA